MNDAIARGLVALGAFLLAGLLALGWLLGNAAMRVVSTVEYYLAD